MYSVPPIADPRDLVERIKFILLPVLGVLLTLVSALVLGRYPGLGEPVEKLIRGLNLDGQSSYRLSPTGVAVGIAIGLSHLILLRGTQWWAKCLWMAGIVLGSSVADTISATFILQHWKFFQAPLAVAWIPARQAIAGSIGIILVPQLLVAALHPHQKLWWIILGTNVGWVLAWLAMTALGYQSRGVFINPCACPLR